MKKCPDCGAAIPEEASFCPVCASSINQRREPEPPRRYLSRKTVWMAAVLLLAALMGAGLYAFTRPKVYEGAGEVFYSDSEGSYQLLTNYTLDRHEPVDLLDTAAGAEERYRFPSYLYINYADSGIDATDNFMEKVSSADFEILQPEDSKTPIKWSDPEPMDINKEAALISLVDFTRESKTPAQLVWTLHMDNGDTVKLSMDLAITPTMIYDYNSENADLSDTAALQALMERAAEEADERDTINIYLPPVTYTEQLVVPDHAFNLIGSEEDGKRTTFTEGIRMGVPGKGYWISYFTGIDFRGDGNGIGLSTAGRAWAKECRFYNWKTAVLGYGAVWTNVTDCVFEDNGIGFHFNARDSEYIASDTHFTGNEFTGNDTAVFLEAVPTDVKMDFGQCVFTDNGADIDNPDQQPIDITQAIFQ